MVEDEPLDADDSPEWSGPPGRKGSALADSADEEDDGRVGDEARRARRPLREIGKLDWEAI